MPWLSFISNHLFSFTARTDVNINAWDGSMYAWSTILPIQLVKWIYLEYFSDESSVQMNNLKSYKYRLASKDHFVECNVDLNCNSCHTKRKCNRKLLIGIDNRDICVGCVFRERISSPWKIETHVSKDYKSMKTLWQGKFSIFLEEIRRIHAVLCPSYHTRGVCENTWRGNYLNPIDSIRQYDAKEPRDRFDWNEEFECWYQHKSITSWNL